MTPDPPAKLVEIEVSRKAAAWIKKKAKLRGISEAARAAADPSDIGILEYEGSELVGKFDV